MPQNEAHGRGMRLLGGRRPRAQLGGLTAAGVLLGVLAWTWTAGADTTGGSSSAPEGAAQGAGGRERARAEEPDGDLTILLTGNVRGELEPCG